MSYPKPFNEPERLRALLDCNVLDTGPEEPFEGAVDIARSLFGTPIALVSLSDEGRQWFKARRGLEDEEAPRAVAFCAFAIMEDDVMVVTDASADPRFADNPLVCGEPFLQFYVGAPLISSDGFRLGTLCVIDTESHPAPDDDKLGALRNLAAMVTRELERRRPEPAETSLPENPAEQAKHDFLALMSHELRTPLNAILGFSELIELTSADPSSREYAADVRASANHQLGLIERLLTFCQVDRGDLGLSEEIVQPGAAVAKAIAAMRGTASRSGVAVELETAAGIGPIKADATQLHHMLMNLLMNAVQSGARSVRATARRGDDRTLVLEIEDDGRGIDAASRQQALGAFAVATPVLSRKGEGIGIGLPLTQRLVEMHGGTLTLAPGTDGAGTRATLTFPAWRFLATPDVDRAAADAERRAS